MTDADVIALLDKTGHLSHPFGEPTVSMDPYPTDVRESRVINAVASYQDFMALPMEPLIAKHHPERRSAAVAANGIIGPATAEILESPRCMVPDYGVEAAAVGQGNWKRCHNIGDFHAAVVKINTAGMPSFLVPLFSQVWERVVAAYAEIGLKFIRDDNAVTPNIDFSFVGSSDGWIGLAIVGTGQTCGGRIWCRYLSTYKGGSTNDQIITQWTSLVKHELGHNCGLQHSRGGVMNPAIVNGLPVSWKGDPSEPLLRSYFGGVAIPKDPDVPPSPRWLEGYVTEWPAGKRHVFVPGDQTPRLGVMTLDGQVFSLVPAEVV